MRDNVSCRGHENCVKVTGEGGGVSNKRLRVYGGKQGLLKEEVTRASLRSPLGQQTTSRPMPGALGACAFLLLKVLL